MIVYQVGRAVHLPPRTPYLVSPEASMNYPFGRGWTRAFPYLGLLPALLLYTLFLVGPSLSTIVLSFTNISGVPDTPWQFIGTANYREFFSPALSRDNLDALGRTFIFCISVTLIQNAIALLLAVILNTRLMGHLFFRALFFMPVVLGVTIIGLTWSLVFNPVDGPAEHLLGLFGQNSAFFGSYTAAFPLVIAIQIWSAMGYSLVIFLAGLQTIPQELVEAGRVDGANGWQVFYGITFPLLRPSVTANVLLAIIGSLQTYQIIYVLTRGGFNTSVLGLAIFSTGFAGSQRQGYASSLSVLQFLIVLFVALLAQLYLRRKEVQL